MIATDRDRILMMILPALVIAVGYGLFFFRGQYRTHAAAQTALAEARVKSLPPNALAAQRSVQMRLEKEERELQAQLEALQAEWRYAAAFAAAPAQRTQRVEKLTALWKKHNVAVLEDTLAESHRDAKLSPAVERLAKKLAQDAGVPKLQERRIRIVARYHDLLDVFEELAHGEALAIPVGLTMKPHDDSIYREWVVLIWI